MIAIEVFDESYEFFGLGIQEAVVFPNHSYPGFYRVFYRNGDQVWIHHRNLPENESAGIAILEKFLDCEKL